MEVLFIILILILCFIIYLIIENKYLKVTVYKVEQAQIPLEFSGIKIVCLTDLHGNTFGKNNRRLLRKIHEYHPDYVVAVGDMITCRKKLKIKTVRSLLLELAKEYPVYYAYGNHESRLVKRTDKHIFSEYRKELEDYGVTILDNSHITFIKGEDSLCIHGLTLPLEYFEKSSKEEALDVSNLTSLLGRAENQSYHILLAHMPIYFNTYAKWGADLILSGHIHGGIVILPFFGGMISPQYKIFPKYDYGKFEIDDSIMLLSRGLGTHTIPVRVFNRPELMCIELKNTNI